MAREFRMGARIDLHTNNYSSTMANVIRATQNLNGDIVDLDQSMGRYYDSQGRLRESNGRFASSLGSVSGQLQDQSGEAQTLTNRFFNLHAAIAALGSVVALNSLYDWLIESNASMEQYQNTLSVVLKSEEKAVETLAWANKFAAQTPFEIPQIVEATTVMASYGMNAQETLGIIGDMASVMGKDLMQAVEAVADANTGELERLKEFGITKKMIEEQATLMGKQVFDKKGSMQDQAAFNEVLFKMMEDRYKGGMAMQAVSFKGMISNAQDYIATIGRTLGKPVFDKMKIGMGSILEVANRLQEDGTIDAWISGVQTGFGKMSSLINKTLTPVKGLFALFQGGAKTGKGVSILSSMGLSADAIKTVIGMVGTIKKVASGTGTLLVSAFNGAKTAISETLKVTGRFIDFFLANFPAIQPYIIGIATALLTYKLALMAVNTYTKIVAKAQLAWNAIMAMNPIILVVLAIGLLIGYLIHMAGGWDVVKEKLLVFWGVMVNTFNKLKAVVMPLLASLGSKLSNLFTKALPHIRTAITFIKNLLVTWATNIWSTIGPLVMILWTGIVNIFNSLKAFFTQWGSLIISAFQVYWSFVSSLFISYASILWVIVKGAFSYIYNIVSGIFKLIVGVIEIGWSLISGIFSVFLNLLSGDWQGAWDAMLGMLDGVWTGIKTFFSGLKDLFFDSGKAIITTLVDGIKAMASAPVKAIKAVLEKVREFLPFSDAKKGPLSNLTLNGGKIVTTMAEGIYKQKGTLAGAMGTVLNDMPGANVAANGGTIVPGSANPAGRTSAGRGNGKSVIIQKLVDVIEIHGADGKNAKALVDELLEELYARFQNAAEILSSLGLGELLDD